MEAPIPNGLTFVCTQCGGAFQATQGSRRRYCNDCIVERIRRGGRPPKKEGS